jgi:hypothetical protein
VSSPEQQAQAIKARNKIRERGEQQEIGHEASSTEDRGATAEDKALKGERPSDLGEAGKKIA